MDIDREQTRAYFDSKAPEWDRRMQPDRDERHRIQAAIDRLGISPGHQVLDAGCGTGVLFPYLLSRMSPPGCLYALDISSEMLAEARRKHGKRMIRYINNDILAFARTVPGGWLDRIVCFSAFPHFQQKDEVVRGFHSLLREGGRLLIFHLQDSQQINAIHASLPNEQIRTHTLPEADLVRATAAATGFRVIESSDCEEGYCLLVEKHSSPNPP